MKLQGCDCVRERGVSPVDLENAWDEGWRLVVVVVVVPSVLLRLGAWERRWQLPEHWRLVEKRRRSPDFPNRTRT